MNINFLQQSTNNHNDNDNKIQLLNSNSLGLQVEIDTKNMEIDINLFGNKQQKNVQGHTGQKQHINQVDNIVNKLQNQQAKQEKKKINRLQKQKQNIQSYQYNCTSKLQIGTKQPQKSNQTTKMNKNTQKTQKRQKFVQNSQQKEQRIIKKQKLSLPQTLENHKLLKQTFQHFTKHSPNPSLCEKKTFDELNKQYQILSLNRFMHFCKQYKVVQIIKNAKQNGNTIEIGNMQNQKKQTNKSQSSNLSSNAKSNLQCKRLNSSSKVQSNIQSNNLQRSRRLSSKSNKKMLEMPIVKETQKIQSKIARMYKSRVKKVQHMNFNQFVLTIIDIYQIYKHNINKDNTKLTEEQIQSRFITQILCIDNNKNHTHKLQSLKIHPKISSSFTNQTGHKKSNTKLNINHKPLVVHGGRYQQSMKNQLKLYKREKQHDKQNWINTQGKQVSCYSKSRIFYRPDPSFTYKTNDIVRLARDQTQQPIQNLLIPSLPQPTLNQLNCISISSISEHKRVLDGGLTFSKVFQNKNQSFKDKLDKIKQHYNNKQTKISQFVNRDEDLILKMHFQNQKIVYKDFNQNRNDRKFSAITNNQHNQ